MNTSLADRTVLLVCIVAGVAMAVIAAWLGGDLSEQHVVDGLAAAEYQVAPPVTVRVDAPALVAATPTRGARMQVTPTLPPPAKVVAAPRAGDCESWRPLLARYGIPFDEARPRMVRESQCSNAHNYNPRTGDDSYGPLQANRYGSLARWWDSGGYTAAVMATPEGAVAAAAVLYHSCGWGPWDASRGYPCDGRYLATPSPEWGQW